MTTNMLIGMPAQELTSQRKRIKTLGDSKGACIFLGCILLCPRSLVLI